MKRATYDETWIVQKPTVTSDGGIVTAQHHLAARAGAEILARGGNAVDSAIATGFALAAVEPWMSGLGGCGYMTVYLADEDKVFSIEFGVTAPRNLNPEEYPVIRGNDSDLFSWPSVLENRNVLGPKSVAVPGFVSGMAEAATRFSSLSWQDLLDPAIKLTEAGLQVDWYSSLKIASAARDLSQFPSSRSVYLENGFVPIGEWSGPTPVISLKGLGRTLQRLAKEGPESFYCGSLATDLLRDARSVGIDIDAEDLATYRTHFEKLSGIPYRTAKVFSPQGLCAGPTLSNALKLLGPMMPKINDSPDANTYACYAQSMQQAYRHRLTHVGDSPDGKSSSCTTHLNVIDRNGNIVSLTQTLLSLFGSKVVLPETGILMNNGIMWFDPRPGKANSIAPGRRPLSNMCPTIVEATDGSRFALGASGGRRIMSAVLQLISFLVDFSMDINSAMRLPRVDVRDDENIYFDTRFDRHMAKNLSNLLPGLKPNSQGVFPSLFACPSIACHSQQTQQSAGASFIYSPIAAAIPEIEPTQTLHKKSKK